MLSLYSSICRRIGFFVSRYRRLLGPDFRGDDIDVRFLLRRKPNGNGGHGIGRSLVRLPPMRLGRFNRLNDLRGLFVLAQEPIRRPVCAENSIRVDGATVRLSWRNDRADLVCSGHPGIAVQVEEPA